MQTAIFVTACHYYCLLPPNRVNGIRETPLHHASFFGHLEVVKQLLLAGADPNVKSYSESRHWLTTTPLDVAAKNWHWDVVDFLLRQNYSGRSLRFEKLNRFFNTIEEQGPLYTVRWHKNMEQDSDLTDGRGFAGMYREPRDEQRLFIIFWGSVLLIFLIAALLPQLQILLIILWGSSLLIYFIAIICKLLVFLSVNNL